MRANIDAETLLQIVLVLIVLWLVLAVLEEAVEVVGAVLGIFPFSNLIGLVIAILIVLWLLDRI